MKKALHVKTFCCEGMMDWLHGGGRYVDRIYVPEERLMITFADGKAYAAEGELEEFTSSTPGGKNDRKPEVIKEIEILDDVIMKARSLLALQSAYNDVVASSWKTLGLG